MRARITEEQLRARNALVEELEESASKTRTYRLKRSYVDMCDEDRAEFRRWLKTVKL